MAYASQHCQSHIVSVSVVTGNRMTVGQCDTGPYSYTVHWRPRFKSMSPLLSFKERLGTREWIHTQEDSKNINDKSNADKHHWVEVERYTNIKCVNHFTLGNYKN